jgi:tetratricopeptide (TPR) repeat protein
LRYILGKAQFFKNLVSGLLICFLFFVVVETVLRWVWTPKIALRSDPYVGFSTLHPLYVIKDGTASTSDLKLSMFNKVSFSVKKAPNTFRIFCFGGSTTQGQPYNDKVAFSRWLEDLLKASDPHRNFEVINAGGISYASYRIVPLIQETLQFESDLMVVYTGQNEFLERRTYHNLFSQSRFLVSFRSWLETLRLYHLLELLWRPVLKAGTSGGKLHRASTPHRMPSTDLTKFIMYEDAHEILDDTRRGMNLFFRDEDFSQAVVKHFEYNINRMILLCKNVRVPIIFVEPASNLKDMSPFKSQHSPHIKWSHKNTIENRIREAIGCVHSSSYAQALEILDTEISRDLLYADLHFWRGKALLGMGRMKEAADAFLRAKDLDVCPIRAISSIEAALYSVTLKRGVPLVKFKRALNAKTKDGSGIPGDDCFVDQVHPKIEFHFLIGELILEQLIEDKLIQVDKRLSPDERKHLFDKGMADLGRAHLEQIGDINLSLAYNFNWFGKYREALMFLERMAEKIKEGSEEHRLLIDLYFKLRKFDGVVRELNTLIEHFGDDDERLEYCGNMMLAVGMARNDRAEKDRAIGILKKAVEIGKGNSDPKLSLANAYRELNLLDEASIILQDLVKCKEAPQAFGDLAHLYVLQNRPKDALNVMEQGLRLFPAAEDLIGIYGIVLAENERLTEAISPLKHMVEIDPADHYCDYALATVYSRLGNSGEAVRYLRQALQKGFSDMDRLRNDPKLDDVRKSPEFAVLRSELE